MKKIISVLILSLMVVTIFSGCGAKPATKQVEGTLEEIMDKIYAQAGNPEVNIMKTPVTAENAEYYFGTTEIAYTEALAGEPAINAIAHSLVLLRVAQDADVEAIKTKIKQSANPAKWICVVVPADKVVVDSIGNLIMLVMDNESEKYQVAFTALKPE